MENIAKKPRTQLDRDAWVAGATEVLTAGGRIVAVGAALPLGAAALLPLGQLALGVSAAALIFLMLLGGVGAAVGGAPVGKGVLRVAFWGVLAMSWRGRHPLAPPWLVTCAGLPAAGFAQTLRWPRGGASVVAPALAAP